MPVRRKIRVVIATALSCAVPGLGHLYAGYPMKAIAFYSGAVMIGISFLIGLHDTFFGLIFTLLFTLLYIISTSLYSGFLSHKKPIEKKTINSWQLFLFIITFHISAVYLLIYVFPLKPYKIPSSSMEPSLLIGDYFMADKRHYNHHKLKRGDIIIFSSPTNPPMDFVKRVAGLPGEVLELKNGWLLINGQKISNYSTEGYWGPMKINPNDVFVLGDNPTHSYDSRQLLRIAPIVTTLTFPLHKS